MIHEIQIRVRLSETDALGIVYYSNYFIYFDVARIELLRSVGIDSEILDKKWFKFLCLEASCKYLVPLRFDDLITVKTWIEKIGEKSIVYKHLIVKNGSNVAEGHVVDVLTDLNGKPVKLPDEWKKNLSKHKIT